MIMFIRYAPLLADMGASVVVECQPGLSPLLASADGVAKACNPGDVMPPFDVFAPLLSLPLLFKTDEPGIPRQIPYLHPDPNRSARWRDVVRAQGSARKVGIVWSGNSVPDPHRSIPVELLQPLFEVGDVTFFSLQKGEAAGDIRRLPFPIVDTSAGLTDFAETAALIENLDLVISIDTAVAHLAGAVGKSTWTLLPHAPDWRWLRDRRDSPWYPGMFLFRQPALGDWSSVVRQVAAALASWTGS
jgi:hypothetical protein